MNKKKIKKLTKEISDRLSKEISYQVRRELEPKAVNVDSVNGYFTNEYNKEVSARYKKLALNIINYPDNIRLSYNESYITIEIYDILSLKNKQQKQQIGNHNVHVKVNTSNSVSLQIYKNYFSLSRGYGELQSQYKDENMYNDLIGIIKAKVIEINNKNFENIYNDIAIESGLLRDSNLDDILQ